MIYYDDLEWGRFLRSNRAGLTDPMRLWLTEPGREQQLVVTVVREFAHRFGLSTPEASTALAAFLREEYERRK